jgi:integrase
MYPLQGGKDMPLKGTRFTDKFILNLKPKTKEYWKREGMGFSIRILPSGEKIWYYIYTFEGRKRFMRLGEGNYPDVSLSSAREFFDIAKVKVKNGIDPLDEKQTAETERIRTPTIAKFIEEYIERYAKKHKRSWRDDERALKTEIEPRWGRKKITDIRRRDLVVILDKIIERGSPIMANRLLAYTRKMFSFAVERDVIEINPFLGMKAPSPKVERERNLSENEIKILWGNLETARISDNVKRALKLIIVTGQRPGEVVGMHNREIEGRWWTIPAERSKNKQAHRVYLTDTAIALIGENHSYVFPSPVNEGKPLEIRTLSNAIKKNLPHTLESKVEDKLGIPYFIPHDLRRTAASRMAESGISGDLIERIQNHVQKKGVAHIYNRYDYDKEKQTALEAWERKLKSIISGKAVGTVVSISTAKGYG